MRGFFYSELFNQKIKWFDLFTKLFRLDDF